jgi:predicted nucleic acid-binding protein
LFNPLIPRPPWRAGLSRAAAREASYQLLKAALSGELSFAVSPLVAFEYEGVLTRRIEEGFLKVSEKDCRRILSALFTMATIVWRPLQIRPVLSDPSDDKILENAQRANYNKNFLTFGRLSGLRQDSPPFGRVPGFPAACCRDLQCAVSGDCTHIITFNKKHFPSALTAPWRMKVMTAGEFLRNWRDNR